MVMQNKGQREDFFVRIPVVVCNDFFRFGSATGQNKRCKNACSVFAHSAEEEQRLPCFSSFRDDLACDRR